MIWFGLQDKNIMRTVRGHDLVWITR